MNLKNNPFARTSIATRAGRQERGQILPLAAVTMFVFFCFCGFVVDTGRIYVAFEQLQASTDAAALAGGQGLPSGSATAIANATAYGSTGTNKNSAILANVTMPTTPQVACVPFSSLAIACNASEGIYNAIQVQQSVNVPMTFAQFFGTKTVALTATATASSQGSNSTPYNIALIIDTTASMGGNNSDSCTDPSTGKSYSTSIGCALVGAHILLQNTAPCYSDMATCTGAAASSVDMISIFTFPNGTVNTMANDYSNGCGGPTIASTYSFPSISANSYSPSNATAKVPTNTDATYQVTPFLSDYRTSDATTTLSSSSNLTAAIGQKSGCAGLQTPGGLGTYYAGALVAAQDALLAQQASSGRTGSLNAIVLLSDGEANATKMASTIQDTTTTVSKTAATYPSTINQCQQAIDAATQISATGTKIYTVAYGSATVGGCTTDISGSLPGIAACTAMQKIATSGATFYTDTPASNIKTGCTSALQPAQGLAQIFSSIAGDLTSARLIPNSVFSGS